MIFCNTTVSGWEGPACGVYWDSDYLMVMYSANNMSIPQEALWCLILRNSWPCLEEI